MDPPYKAQCQW